MAKQAFSASDIVNKIGRWNLVADAASNLWVAAQPNICLPKILVDAQITTDYIKNTAQHTLILKYIIILSAEPKSSKTYHTTANGNNSPSDCIKPWFTWLPLASQLEQVKPADFLWQSTCLECFLAGTTSDKPMSESQQYIEINIATNGQHAIYHFDDYRSPASMPPRKLTTLPIIQDYLQSNSDSLQQQPLLTVSSATNLPEITSTNPCTNQVVFTRQISMSLSPLTKLWTNLSLICPTVILKHQNSEQLLYFAPHHTSPPDFHQQALWSNIHFVL